jgi:IPT/TIG domain
MPVVASGNYEMRVGSLFASAGSWTPNGGATDFVDAVRGGSGKSLSKTRDWPRACPIPPGDGTVYISSMFAGTHSLSYSMDSSWITLGSDPPIALAGLPAGFDPTTFSVKLAGHTQWQNAPSPNSLIAFRIHFNAAQIYSDTDHAFHTGEKTATTDPLGVLALSGVVRLEWEVVNNAVTGGTPCGPLDFVDLDINITHLYATGTYVIVWVWYVIPAVDACGEAHASQLVLAATPPTPDYLPLDPDDPDAVPTVTITDLAPSHGPIAGGTSVTIRGSGFGQGASVTFGGVAATDVVVVDQFTITATAPAGAGPGPITVAVTNTDGT